MVLPKTAPTASRDPRRGTAARSRSAHAARGDARRSPTCRRRRRSAQALYRESQKPENYTRPVAEPRALHRRAPGTRRRSRRAYNADPAALPFDGAAGLAAARRAEAGLARCRTPRTIAADWKDMQVPGNWESRGLPDFDGVVWFTRTFDCRAAAATGTRRCRSGAMRNTGEVWVNGLADARRPPAARGAARRRGAAAVRRRRTRCRPARFKPGANKITVRIQNARQRRRLPRHAGT